MKKHKKQKRKPRVPIVGIGFDRDVEISYIHIDEGQKLIFKDEHGNLLEPSVVTVGDAYLRRSKPKVLRELPAEPTDIKLDVKRLLRSHDATLVVDTNYHDFGDFRLCVSASILILYEIEESRRMANFSPQSSLVFSAPCTENPERFGWWDIIERFMKSPFCESSKSYGLVVDSDLRDLSGINSRQTAVWEQNYLPAGFQILYASADVRRKNYINQAISLCDKRAGKALSQILPGFDRAKMRERLNQAEHFRLCYVKSKDEVQ